MPRLGLRELSEIVSYDPTTGLLTWRVTRNNRSRAGEIAGTRTGDGYRIVRIGDYPYNVHRIAFLLMTGEWPKYQVDHINGCITDNRWENLRSVKPQENCRNGATPKNNTSGLAGIHVIHETAYTARICVDFKNIVLGTFRTFFDAAAARKSAELRYGFHENHGRKRAALAQQVNKP